MEVRYSSHGVYQTEYHVVFITKFRRKILNPGFAKYTEAVIRSAIEYIEGVELVEINVQVDHVHMVMIIPPKYSIADVIRKVKFDKCHAQTSFASAVRGYLHI